MVTPRCEWSRQGESGWLAPISPFITLNNRPPILNREQDHSDQLATIQRCRDARFESLTTRLRLHVRMLAENKETERSDFQ
jgi:hypothetical protein